jgi:hypothetical protein
MKSGIALTTVVRIASRSDFEGPPRFALIIETSIIGQQRWTFQIVEGDIIAHKVAMVYTCDYYSFDEAMQAFDKWTRTGAY